MFNQGGNGGYSLSDIAAATGSNGNGLFGDGNGGWWIILLFILALGGNWGGWGNNGNGGGTPQIASSMDTDYLSTGIRDLTGSVANDFYTLNTGLLNGFCDVQQSLANSTANITGAVTNGFNTQNLANLQNTNAIQRDIYAGTVGAMQNTQAIQSQINALATQNATAAAENQYNMATNTCAINTNNANNTRDIIDSQNAGTRAILDAIQQNKVEAMQDKINALTAQNQALQFKESQAAQNAYLLNELRPSPIPAYITSNPYCNCGNFSTLASV